MKKLGLGNYTKAKIVNLDTGVSTALIPTTDKIKRIEVFETKMIDPLGITLELQPDTDNSNTKTVDD
ncbi:MAG: hypothetical protein AAF717_21615 [Bacteroidota bacterium]